MMAAYYNEFDPKAAAWLRELIKRGHIADGVVDERSIEDVKPIELMGYTQCHFFAGIGVWSYALRRAGWADSRKIWTGSCPCQPFSAAGKGAGFDDERHLWPAFHHLISQCRPDVVFGEQVASKDGLGWLDLVQSDLEATGYASGAVDLCAAGVGAPHIRQRLWWVGKRLGDTASAGLEGTRGQGIEGNNSRPSNASSDVGLADTNLASEGMVGKGSVSLDGGDTRDAWVGLGGSRGHGRLADTTILGRGKRIAHDGWLRGGDCAEGSVGRSAVYGDLGSGLADTSGIRWERGEGSEERREHDGENARWQPCDDGAVGNNEAGVVRLANTERAVIRDCGCGVDEKAARGEQSEKRQRERIWSISGADGSDGSSARPRPTNGFWRDADWLFCRDGKFRPVEPGTSPLVDGAAARVGRLRGYGNAIVAQAAQAFIESVMD